MTQPDTLMPAFASILETMRESHPDAWTRQAVPAAELAALAAAAGTDEARFRRLLKRRLHGDVLAYILGHVDFAGDRFAIDRRAYVTDPETVHLVDEVERWINAHAGPGQVHVAEVGIGAGALAITLLKRLSGLVLTGLELDDAAASLCRENAAAHGVALEVLESDMFTAWGDRPVPKIIYGDLPWGDDGTLYDVERDAAHYHSMPPTTSFPLSGRTGAQRELAAAVRALGWRTELFLNCGTLDDADIAGIVAAGDGAGSRIVAPAATVRILQLSFGGERRRVARVGDQATGT